MLGTTFSSCLASPQTTFFACVGSLPDLIWSGIFGAALALLGVFVTTLFSERRANLQLAHDTKQSESRLSHDASENEKDRKTDARKEVYLAAIGEMLKASMGIAALPINRKPDPSSDFQKLFVSLNRVLLVCEQENAVQILDLNAAYGKTLMVSQVALLPLLKHRSDVDIFQGAAEKGRKEQERLLAAMAAYNEGAIKHPGVFESLMASYEFATANTKKYDDLRSEASVKFQDELETFQRKIFPMIKEISPIQMSVIANMRAELLLDTDRDAIRKKMEINLDEASTALEAIFEAVRSKK